MRYAFFYKLRVTHLLLSGLLSILVSLSSCDNSMDKLDAVSPLEIQVSLNNIKGRAIMLGDRLPDCSQIGVNVTDPTGFSYNADIYNNILYTADVAGGMQNWQSSARIMLTSTPACVYGYYPYKESVDLTCIPIETESQTDYMYATPVSGLDFKNNVVNLEMNHVLTAIRLTLVYNGSLDTPKLSQVSFNSESLATDAFLYGKDGTLSEISGINETITIDVDDVPVTSDANNSASVEYMLVPTGVAADIHFTCIVNDKTYLMTVTPETAFQAGCIYHFVATIDDSSCSLNTVSIDSWTTQSHTAASTKSSCSGVVKAVNANGELIDIDFADNSCIAVALDLGTHKYWIEKNETSNTTWKTAFTTAGATNTGYTNFYWGPYGTDITDIVSYTIVAPWTTSYSTYTLNRNHANWGSGTAITDFSGEANTGFLCSTTATDTYTAYPKASVLVSEFNKKGNAENFGYEDWYIPSLGELALINCYLIPINSALTKIGGVNFSSSNYWSSSEYNSSYGYYMSFSTSSLYINRTSKYNYYRVRLIRKFQ